MHLLLVSLLGVALPLAGGVGGCFLGFALAARRSGWRRRVPMQVLCSAVLGLLLGIIIPLYLFGGVL